MQLLQLSSCGIKSTPSAIFQFAMQLFIAKEKSPGLLRGLSLLFDVQKGDANEFHLAKQQRSDLHRCLQPPKDWQVNYSPTSLRINPEPVVTNCCYPICAPDRTLGSSPSPTEEQLWTSISTLTRTECLIPSLQPEDTLWFGVKASVMFIQNLNGRS
jgi:hypothetical protein